MGGGRAGMRMAQTSEHGVGLPACQPICTRGTIEALRAFTAQGNERALRQKPTTNGGTEMGPNKILSIQN